MTEKRLNNTIYLMYVITRQYCRTYNMSTEEFMELDKKHNILHYISECPDVFDCMTRAEMVEEVDKLCAVT